MKNLNNIKTHIEVKIPQKLYDTLLRDVSHYDNNAFVLHINDGKLQSKIILNTDQFDKLFNQIKEAHDHLEAYRQMLADYNKRKAENLPFIIEGNVDLDGAMMVPTIETILTDIDEEEINRRLLKECNRQGADISRAYTSSFYVKW